MSDTASHGPVHLPTVVCPNCEYDLRGQRGATVTCPECGHECDVAAMLARTFNGPWNRAPGYGEITISTVGIVPAVISFLVGSPLLTLAFLALWIWLLSRANRVLPGGTGLRLALRVHVILGCYALVVASLVLCGSAIGEASGWGLVWAPASIMFLFLGIAAEKRLCTECIRHYLDGRMRLSVRAEKEIRRRWPSRVYGRR